MGQKEVPSAKPRGLILFFGDPEKTYPSRIEINRDLLSLFIDLLNLRVINLNKDLAEIGLKESLNAVAKIYVQLHLGIELAFTLIDKAEALRACHDHGIIACLHIGCGTMNINFPSIESGLELTIIFACDLDWEECGLPYESCVKATIGLLVYLAGLPDLAYESVLHHYDPV